MMFQYNPFLVMYHFIKHNCLLISSRMFKLHSLLMGTNLFNHKMLI